MSDKVSRTDTVEIPIEAERYELSAAPTYHFSFARREFIKLFGGGIAIVFTLKGALAQEAVSPMLAQA